LLLLRLPQTLYAIWKEVFFMKTSNLVALMIALLVTTGGFAGINYLFTQASAGHERASAELVLRA
jgi:hypothetical protein